MAAMATIKHHEDLDAWRLANDLKVAVLEILKRPAIARHVRFCDDIERSSASGPANLAEGFWKYRPKEKACFVRIAIASLGETQNHLRDALDRGFIQEPEFSTMWTLAKRALGASINWHTYLTSCADKPPRDTRRTDARSPRRPREGKPQTSNLKPETSNLKPKPKTRKT